MPQAGGVKITKKLRMMDFWSNSLRYWRITTTYSSPTTSVENRRGVEGGYVSRTDDYSDGQEYEQASWQHTSGWMTVNVNDLPPGALVTRANAMFRCASIENDNAINSKFDSPMNFTFVDDANTLEISNEILNPPTQKTRWMANTLKFPADIMAVPADTIHNGIEYVSDIDCKEVVSTNHEYNFLGWQLFTVGRIIMREFQVGLRVYFK